MKSPEVLTVPVPDMANVGEAIAAIVRAHCAPYGGNWTCRKIERATREQYEGGAEAVDAVAKGEADPYRVDHPHYVVVFTRPRPLDMPDAAPQPLHQTTDWEAELSRFVDWLSNSDVPDKLAGVLRKVRRLVDDDRESWGKPEGDTDQ